MSIEEQNSKIKKIKTTSNEYLNQKEIVPVKTSQSMNTESYEYFSQKKTTKNIITESSVNSLNKNSNSKNKQITSSSGLKCTCNKNQKNELKCTCNQKDLNAQCTCGLYGKKLFEENKISSSNSKQTTNALNVNQQIKKNQQLICNCPQQGKNSQIKSNTKVNINISSNTKVKTNLNINSKKAGAICNCNQNMNQNKLSNSSNERIVENYSYLNSNETQNKSKKINTTKITQKTTITKTKINVDKTNISKEDWNKRCVGQNNENLQIIAPEKPGLIAQCVQDMKVIGEQRPVQILLPIEPNEIDYPLGLEIYGKAKEEKKKDVLICPENIDNLNVSKAYSTIVPQFENLNIVKNDDVSCDRKVIEKYELMEERNELALDKIKKKEKYGEESLKVENGEMYVKGENNFNKDNKAEVITNMNVKGKNKFSWNEMNEAIKTTKMNIDKTEFQNKFDNLSIEQNTLDYEGILKKKFNDEETQHEKNDEYLYQAEYPPIDWNKETLPMSGRPFTITTEKNWTLSTQKGDKLTLKYAYKTKDWNSRMNKRKEIQINMPKRKSKKGVLSKQRVQPVIIKGKENNWNDVIKKDNDNNFHIEKTQINNNNFNITKGDEVHIANEAEEILINDDYNIVEENYTRPIRANIRKVQEYSEESKSSEYDVLKGIEKYQGQIIYKDLINQSLKIHGQKVIINDISGKYPKRVETFQGLDENYQKLSNDQYKQKNINIKINMMKKAQNKNIKIDNESNKIYIQQKVIKKEIANIQPVEQTKKVIYTTTENQVRKITYEPEHEDEYEQEQKQIGLSKIRDIIRVQQQQERMNYEEQQKEISDNNNEPEDEQEPEQEDMEEQENMDVPEDKDHIPEEKNDSNQQPHDQSQEAEDNNNNEPEPEMEEQVENEEPENENENENENNNEEEEQQQRNNIRHQIEAQGEYYYLKQTGKNEKEYLQESPKNQNELDHEEEAEQEAEHENENEHEEENNQNEEEEVKDTQPQNAEENPKSPKSLKNEEEDEGKLPKVVIKEIVFKKTEESPEENKIKLSYITLKKKEDQEDSNSQPNDEEVKPEEQEIEKKEENIQVEKQQLEVKEEIKENKPEQYITMESQKVEEQHISKDENDAQSDLEKEIQEKEVKEEKEENVEQEPENEPEPEQQQVQKQEVTKEQYITMVSQKVEEKHISKDEIDAQSDLEKEKIQKEETQEKETNEIKEENVQNKYVTMESQKVEEQHISKDEDDIKSELNKAVSQYEKEERLQKLKENQILLKKESQKVEIEEHHVSKDSKEDEEEVDNEIEEEMKKKEQKILIESQEILEKKEKQEEVEAEEHSEEHAENHSQENEEEHIEEHVEKKEEKEIKENIKVEKEEKEENKEKVEVTLEVQDKGQIPKDENKENEENKTISSIVANAIKNEMQAQEVKESEETELKSKQQEKQEQKEEKKDGKYFSMVNKFSKHLKENPQDNYGKFAANKLNIMPKVAQVEAQTQNVTLSQVISPEKITTSKPQNLLAKTIKIQSQTLTQTQSITQGNGNAMLYSFGQDSVEGSNLSSSKKKTTNINISASFGKQNTQGTQGIQSSNITFAPIGLSSSQYNMGSGIYTVSGSNLNTAGTQLVSSSRMIYSKTGSNANANLSGKYYFSTSHNSKLVTKKKEPLDTDKRRRKMEREMKAEYEIDSLDIGPRDSKRK